MNLDLAVTYWGGKISLTPASDLSLSEIFSIRHGWMAHPVGRHGRKGFVDDNDVGSGLLLTSSQP